jgi:hypothetical protein
MPSNPNGPQPFPCGGEGQMPCPPQPADEASQLGTGLAYSEDEMWAYGKRCYDKGVADRAQKEAS